jgi:porin
MSTAGGVDDPAARVFQLLLPSEHLFGTWGGLGPWLEARGITPRLSLVTDVAGNPLGGRSRGLTAPGNVEVSFIFDLDTIAGVRGASLFVSMSNHWGRNLSAAYIGNVFDAQQVFGFPTFRVADVSYQQKLADGRVELRLGRFATSDDFLVSAYSCGFMQNAFCGNPLGIFFDTQGMTGGTWGVLAKWKPHDRSYLMGAIYNGDTAVRAHRFHGANLSLHGPPFAIGEVGYQVNGLPGDDKRLGNYKAGAWYDGAHFVAFESGARTGGAGGFYVLFDQVLIPFDTAATNRGFGVVGSATIAPNPGVQRLPWFFTAGVEMRGPFAGRPRDGGGIAFASGYFSDDLQRAQREGRLAVSGRGIQKYEAVIELTYRFDYHKSAFFVQPDVQHIRRPGATGLFENALVLGVQIGINF